MRGRSVRRTTCLMAALAMLASIAVAQPIPEPGLTRVVSLTGTLTVTRLRQDPWLLRLHDAVQSGDELATGENSQAVLRSADGSTVVVYPDSRLVFNERSADVRELLHLYVVDPHTRSQIDGILKISSRPGFARSPGAGPVTFIRGIEVDLTLEDDRFAGSGVFLFASAIEQFLARYVALNAFTRLTLHTQQRGEIMRWPIRAGRIPLL